MRFRVLVIAKAPVLTRPPHGTGEATPTTNISATEDPLHYIKHQEKVVEPEDEAWAL